MHEGPLHVVQSLYLVLQVQGDVVRLGHGHGARKDDLHLHID